MFPVKPDHGAARCFESRPASAVSHKADEIEVRVLDGDTSAALTDRHGSFPGGLPITGNAYRWPSVVTN
jgi:hypothetical protein